MATFIKRGSISSLSNIPKMAYIDIVTHAVQDITLASTLFYLESGFVMLNVSKIFEAYPTLAFIEIAHYSASEVYFDDTPIANYDPVLIGNMVRFRSDLAMVDYSGVVIETAPSAVDLTPVTNALSTIQTTLGQFDLTELNNIHEDIVSFKTHFDSLQIIPKGFVISLDGKNCEYKDLETVNVSGRTGIYTVDWSTFGMVTDSQFTPIYSVTSSNGHNLIVPEALLSIPVVV